MPADRGMRKINNNRHNNYNNKPVAKIRFFCSSTIAQPCRYCSKLIRTSQSLGIVEVDPNNHDSDGIRGGNMTTSATAPIIIKNPIRATNVANPKNVGSEKRMAAAERENGVIVEITSIANNLFMFRFVFLMEGC